MILEKLGPCLSKGVKFSMKRKEWENVVGKKNSKTGDLLLAGGGSCRLGGALAGWGVLL